MKRFEQLHPVVSLVYFIFVIFITMFSTNPIIGISSFIASYLFDISLRGFKKALKSFLYMLPLIILVAITNPIFNSRGTTILFFLNDNPFTLEALLYGINASIILFAIFNWFKCFSFIFTSDKFIYLFGRILPKFSLILSLVFAFIPRFKKKFEEIDEAQKSLGIYQSKSYIERIKSKFRVLSILISYSLESSIETADSMKSRGYGLKGRSSYSIFKFTKNDLFILISFMIIGGSIVTLMILKSTTFYFYPSISNLIYNNLTIPTYILFILLSLLGPILELKEVLLWAYLKQKI